MEQQRFGGVPTEVLTANVRLGREGWTLRVVSRLWGETQWRVELYEALTATELAQVLEAAEDRWRPA
jgi:hypothetical protein